MSYIKRILVVDDHFETLAVMRAMLEGAEAGYVVRTVPSGEEGMLELGQGGYDLLITDVRLPGMTGLELVRRMRRVQPGLPVIVLTGYGSVVWEEEARALGVERYLLKPVDGEVLLTAVYAILKQTQLDTVHPPSMTPSTPAVATVGPLQQRLEMLRAETSALELLLVQMDGLVVDKVGGSSGVDWGRVVAPLAQMMRSSVALADVVASGETFALQYHDWTPWKLTSATVGRGYFLTLVFEPDSRRSRVGTVWLFVQRAVAELLQLLGVAPEEGTPVWEQVEQVQGVAEEGGGVQDGSELALDVAELGALLGLSLDETAVPDDLDSFWSQAMDESEVKSEGMTLAEARRRGILPSGLDFDET